MKLGEYISHGHCRKGFQDSTWKIKVKFTFATDE